MNVAHISTAKTWRGGEQQIAYLYQELHDHGVNQIIVCVEGSALEKYAAERRWNCATAQSAGSFSISFWRQIAAACYLQNIDIIHLHDSHAHNNALLAKYFSGVTQPMVLSRRVIFPVGGNPYLNGNTITGYQKILCVSEAVREVMADVVHDATKLSVIYEAVDVSKKSITEGKLRSEYNIPNEVKIIGNIAALTKEKDLITLLKTAARLKGKINAKYVIVGEGKLRPKIEAAIKQMGLENDVILTGFRSDAKVLLAEMDVLLLTSLQEGLGTTVLDAFLCNVPVVATAAGGVPELVKHVVTGMLAPIRDDEQLADNVTRVIKMIFAPAIDNQRSKKVQEHSTTVMAAKTLAVYKDILDKL